MKNEKETKQKLLECAKKEFLEKGFLQASLRNICKEAGVTTGALYFFFKDKEDLFANIVEGPLQKIMDIAVSHYQKEIEDSEKGIYACENNAIDDYTDDQLAANQIIHYFYKYYDEFQLLLLKSQGTKYENAVDTFVEMTDKHYTRIMDTTAAQRGTPKKSKQLIHWMSHMQINIFVYLLTHEQSEERACELMADIMQYLMNGYNGLFK